MYIKLWGVRGSLPTPLSTEEFQYKILKILKLEQEKLKDPSIDLNSIIENLPEELSSVIGGETTCIEVCHNDTQLILDSGSGIRNLGLDMQKRGLQGDVNILFTHTHWDHIQGWPHFPPWIQERKYDPFLLMPERS